MTAISLRRSWRGAASAALIASVIQPAATPVLECSLPGDDSRRVYQLIDAGAAHHPRWLLRLSAPAVGGDRRVDLPLGNARVDKKNGGLVVSSASANGGAAVQIEAAAGSGTSTLDVFVNFELEVNVWRDLPPEVERMNTNGVQAAACRVLSIPEPMPYHR